MLRVAAIFTLCERIWTACAWLYVWGKLRQFSYGETLFWVALKIGVNPSLCILKFVSEKAPRNLRLHNDEVRDDVLQDEVLH